MRHESDAHIAPAAELAIACHEQADMAAPCPAAARVIGFDLAGPEAGWPASRQAALLARVRNAGLGLTLHAGEADGGERVLQAVRLGAQRIGHGVRLAEPIADLIADRPAADRVLAELKAHGTHLETCPTSNVHTGAAASLALHPIHAL